MQYNHLRKEGKIGSLSLKNRFIMPSMGTSYGDNEGHITKQSIDYYTERAKGGFGLIIVEVTGVDKQGICTPNQPGLWSDEFIPYWKELTESVHRYDSKIAVQLHHAGRQTSPELIGRQPVSSSTVACPVFDVVPHELTVSEIYELVEKFGDAAKRAKDSGFDAVELHAAHGYLVAQFVSPQVNKRFDEFGGSLEGRAKFPVEIIKNIKKKCGNDFPVIVRISGDEKVDDGLNISETKILSQYFEEAGADAIHVTICTYGSLKWMFVPADTPSGFNAYTAAEIKESVSIPVIAVGRLNTPEIQEDVLATGKADFVSLGRESLADPEFPNKVLEGRTNEISPCIACLQSCAGYLMNPEKLKISCLVNPRTGHEGEYKLEKAEQSKKVMIVGSGPAGLEAAWVAAKRGHQVTVYEKADKLGGQFRIAGMPPTKHLILSALKYYITMGTKYGVTYKMNTEVTKELVMSEKPDAIIIATGGEPLLPNIPGINNSDFVNAVDVLEGKKTVGRNVLIAGGGMIGSETAGFLGDHNRKVTIIDMLPDIAMETFLGIREHLVSHVKACGTDLVMNAKIKEFLPNGVVYEQNGRTEELTGFDSIVLAMGVKSVNTLEESLKGMAPEIYVIGDAKKVGQANAATEAALAVADQL